MKLYNKSLTSKSLYTVFCAMLILSINAPVFAEAIKVEDSPLVTQMKQDYVSQLQILNSVSKIQSELKDILECYRQITVDLGIDTLPGIAQALKVADNTFSFFELNFQIIEDLFGGFDFVVGKDTVTIGGIPILKDIIKSVEDEITNWATVACRASNAITNNCAQRNPVDSFPNAVYGCWRECRLPFELTRIWVNLVALARLVENTVDKGAKQTIVAVGGGNLSLIMAPISVVVAFTRLVADNIQSCDGNIQGSEIAASYLRLAALRGDHIYSDSVFNAYLIFDLRTRIEINLGGHGNHPHPIAIFQLPAQFGGYLELARDITKETILTMILAGQDVDKAERFFGEGEAEFAAGNYKRAYAEYGKAYRAATRAHGHGG